MNKQLENKLSSREVCEMMEMEHSKLLRKIDGINEDFNQAKIGFVKYWIEGTYRDSKGEERREFQITKKGCEFLAHKTTGTKGNLFTDKYMDKFATMEEIITNPNGIIAQLSEQISSMYKYIENTNLRIQGLEAMISKGRKYKLQISEPLEQRLSYINTEMINDILVSTLTTGLLRITDEGNVVDKEILFAEAKKLNVSKHDIKLKLKLLNKIIYKQVRINGQNMWCIVVKR